MDKINHRKNLPGQLFFSRTLGGGVGPKMDVFHHFLFEGFPKGVYGLMVALVHYCMVVNRITVEHDVVSRGLGQGLGQGLGPGCCLCSYKGASDGPTSTVPQL